MELLICRLYMYRHIYITTDVQNARATAFDLRRSWLNQRRNGTYFALFHCRHRFTEFAGAHCIKVAEYIPNFL